MSKSSISLKGNTDPAALAQMLEDLARGVRAGTVCLQRGGEFVTLKPAGNLEFEIEAAEKKGKQKLEVSIKWEEPCQVANPEDIRISSEVPEVPEEPCVVVEGIGLPPVGVPVVEAPVAGVQAEGEVPAESGEKSEKHGKHEKHEKHGKPEKHGKARNKDKNTDEKKEK